MLAGLALAPGAGAQGVTDPGDLAFWQSIQSSKEPAEYRAYLQSYPSGRFAGLAKVRAGLPDGGGPPPAPDPAPTYSFTVSPQAGRVGQQFSFGCAGLPTGGERDKIVVVPAGSPVMDPTRSQADTKVIWADYAANCGRGDLKGGPFAPGAYEARWMTTLMNNDLGGRYEMMAKTPFTVR